MKATEADAPSFLASYLINGDSSGLEDADRLQADAWINRNGLGMPVSCDDAGFMRRHDAFTEFPFAADCQTYVFLVAESRNDPR